MKALDLFCGPGGTAKGLKDSGFDVLGIDKKDQDYPFEYLKCSVFDLPMDFFDEFDFIWASPPCQGYIHTNKNREGYERLIPETRKLLQRTRKPFVIENVPSDFIRKDLMLCGTMFGLKVLRHRFFEINGFHVEQPKHFKHDGLVATGDYVAVYNGSPGNPRTKKRYGELPRFSIEEQQKALGITWTRRNITEAIPPKYSEYIGKSFFKQTPLPLIRGVSE